jgi:hypothetical protein
MKWAGWACCAALAALCTVQWITLRRLKAQLAFVNVSAVVAEFNARSDEIARVITWREADIRGAGDRTVCAQGDGDAAALRDISFDLFIYLDARQTGASEATARKLVLDANANGVQAGRKRD